MDNTSINNINTINNNNLIQESFDNKTNEVLIITNTINKFYSTVFDVKNKKWTIEGDTLPNEALLTLISNSLSFLKENKNDSHSIESTQQHQLSEIIINLYSESFEIHTVFPFEKAYPRNSNKNT